MEQNKLLNKPFKQTFHIADIKHKNVGIPIITKYIPIINILDSKINIRDKYTRKHNTSLTFIRRMNKQPPFFSKCYPINNKERKHLKPLLGYIYEFPIKQVQQYDKSQNRQNLYMSDLEIRTIHKFFRVTISSIKYKKNSYIRHHYFTCFRHHFFYMSLIVQHKKITLLLGFLGYCETKATTSPTKEVAYRVNNNYSC